jgi:hypothetical protein
VVDDDGDVALPFAEGELVDPDPAQPSSGSPRRRRSSAATRSMIRPTVGQLIRISSQTAVFEQCVASHATCCSNTRVKRLPCRAHPVRATTTP